MRNSNLKVLVNSCATLAARGKDVSSWILVYQMKDGTITYGRGGQLTTQIGLMEVAKTGILNGTVEQSDAKTEG